MSLFVRPSVAGIVDSLLLRPRFPTPRRPPLRRASPSISSSPRRVQPLRHTQHQSLYHPRSRSATVWSSSAPRTPAFGNKIETTTLHSPAAGRPANRAQVPTVLDVHRYRRRAYSGNPPSELTLTGASLFLRRLSSCLPDLSVARLHASSRASRAIHPSTPHARRFDLLHTVPTSTPRPPRLRVRAIEKDAVASRHHHAAISSSSSSSSRTLDRSITDVSQHRRTRVRPHRARSRAMVLRARDLTKGRMTFSRTGSRSRVAAVSVAVVPAREMRAMATGTAREDARRRR